MKSINREKGYTLVIVLVVIVIIGVFIPSIISNLMSSNLQYLKSEQNIQLKSLANMGVTYLDKSIDMASKEAKSIVVVWINEPVRKNNPPNEKDITDKYFEEFKKELNKLIPINAVIKMEGDNSQFKMMIDPINNQSTIPINYAVTATLYGKTEVNSKVEGQKIININLSDAN